MLIIYSVYGNYCYYISWRDSCQGPCLGGKVHPTLPEAFGSEAALNAMQGLMQLEVMVLCSTNRSSARHYPALRMVLCLGAARGTCASHINASKMFESCPV